jgi:hypothetical protein
VKKQNIDCEKQVQSLLAKVQLLLGACSHLGMTKDALQPYLRDPRWHFPRAMATKSKGLHRIFDSHRESAENPRKIRHWVEQRLRTSDDVRTQVASFEALCQEIDLLVLAKKRLADINGASDALAAAVAGFLRLHTTAYGEGHLRPKHHWLLDMPPQSKRHSLVVDACVVERTHLVVKQVADQVRNTDNAEHLR